MSNGKLRTPKNKKEEDMMQKLRKAVFNNQIQKIHAIVKNNKYLLDYIYPEECLGILLLACGGDDDDDDDDGDDDDGDDDNDDDGDDDDDNDDNNDDDGVSAETVSTLLSLGADPKEFCKSTGFYSLHFAAKTTNYDILNILLELNPEIIDVVNFDGENALHTLIRRGDIESTVFPKCVELLIQKGIDVNHTNYNNESPIALGIVRHLDANLMDLMKNQVRQHNLEDNEGGILLKYLKEEDIDKFVNFKNGNIEKWVNYSEDSYTLLQLCCKKKLAQAAIHLLEKGADYEGTSPQNSNKPIVIAAQEEDKETFKVLLGKYTDILKIPTDALIESIFDNGCSQILIERLKEAKDTHSDEVAYKLNEEDEDENTVLSYAVVFSEPHVIKELLSLGASLGGKGEGGTMPVTYIEKEVLKSHLDECLEFNLKERQEDMEDFMVTFKYRTLIPPCLCLKDSTINTDVESSNIEKKLEKKLVAETQVIEFMSKSLELKDLLKHPTITSYLHLKWLRLRWIFWVNLICYVIFALSLLTYIVIKALTEKSQLHSTAIHIFQIIFTIGSLSILLRELLQIIIEPKKYFMKVENYVELSLMAMSGIISYDIFFKNDARIGLFALVILLVAFELILLLGQHPSFSTNVVIFRTVSYNYFKFFLWYSLPIIAFAVSFSIVFASNRNNNKIGSSDNNITNSSTGVKDNKEDPFNSLPGSIFKTMIMLTGEFDSGSLKFEGYPVTSRIIFAAFVFTVAIILLNLLNGLAVSDIQQIQNDAELIGYISRTGFIAGIETVLIGNISIVKYTQKLFDKFSSSPSRDWENRLGQYLSPIACIFPKIFNYEVTFYPRQDGLINQVNGSDSSKSSNSHFDENTVLKTNLIIQEKRNDEINNKNNDIKKLKSQQELLAGKIDTVLKLVSKQESKIDTILKLLSRTGEK